MQLTDRKRPVFGDCALEIRLRIDRERGTEECVALACFEHDVIRIRAGTAQIGPVVVGGCDLQAEVDGEALAGGAVLDLEDDVVQGFQAQHPDSSARRTGQRLLTRKSPRGRNHFGRCAV